MHRGVCFIRPNSDNGEHSIRLHKLVQQIYEIQELSFQFHSKMKIRKCIHDTIPSWTIQIMLIC